MFRAVIGHDRQKRLLEKLRSAKNIPQALLFEGSDGIGKQLVAKAFATKIVDNDLNRLRIIDRLPDKKNISIDQIRELKHEAILTGFSEGMRVFIINNADKMTTEAANSFLKILEEPPREVCFFLISGSPEALPETILSRALRLKFNELARVDAVQALMNAGADKSLAVQCTNLAGGNVATARKLCSYGQELIELSIRWYKSIVTGGYAAIYDICEQFGKINSEDKEKAALLLLLLRLQVRDLLYSACEINRTNFSTAPVASGQANIDMALAADNCFTVAERAINGNANFRLTTEKLFIEIQDLFSQNPH
ncbi:MAG: AAA family ATPase [Bacillota bacterium]